MEATEDRLRCILALGEEIFSLGPVELVQRNVCSPIRLFIKDEPHSSKKRLAGKLRLISGMSVDDQLLDRMCFRVQNKKEVDHWTKFPSKPGISLSDDGLAKVRSELESFLSHGPVQSTDISGWDWSVQEWEMLLDVRVRLSLMSAPDDSLISLLARVRTHCAANKVFCLPDGSLVAQTQPGVQPSGWYNTSSTNSRMRVAARVAVLLLSGSFTSIEDARLVMSMGDDAVEGLLSESALRWYEELGHTVKDVSRSDSVAGIEFCSHRFLPSGLAYPVNTWKTAYRFFTNSPASKEYFGLLSQLRQEWRNHPEADKLLPICDAHAEWAIRNSINDASQKDQPESRATVAAPASREAQGQSCY